MSDSVHTPVHTPFTGTDTLRCEQKIARLRPEKPSRSHRSHRSLDRDMCVNVDVDADADADADGDGLICARLRELSTHNVPHRRSLGPSPGPSPSPSLDPSHSRSITPRRGCGRNRNCNCNVGYIIGSVGAHTCAHTRSPSPNLSLTLAGAVAVVVSVPSLILVTYPVNDVNERGVPRRSQVIFCAHNLCTVRVNDDASSSSACERDGGRFNE
jgi:hypothetical protein